jgi:beta-lactam-binding protein with PASTA domain
MPVLRTPEREVSYQIPDRRWQNFCGANRLRERRASGEYARVPRRRTARSDTASAEPEPRRRAGRVARLVVTGMALATIGTCLALVYAGWWLHERDPGKPVSVAIKRPITVIRDAGAASGSVPNVLGLDVDTARQAMIDAGVDPARVATEERPYAGEAGLVVSQRPAPGARRQDRVLLAVSARAQMPAVAGDQIRAARERLADLGARVVVRSRFDSGAAEGTVLSTRPAEGEVLSDSATLTVAEASSSVFLSQLESVSSDCSVEEELTMNGRAVKNPLTCSPSSDYASEMEYVLNRRVARFVATVGLGDRGGDRVPARFRVVVDGRMVATRTVAFGQIARIAVPVAGALRLRLETRMASGREQDDSPIATWGNARLLGGQSAIDALIKESE